MNIVTNLVTVLITILVTRAILISGRFRRLGHLRQLSKLDDLVQIVIPDFGISTFVPQTGTQRARIPTNVRVMPLAEGEAIGNLVSTLREAGYKKIELINQNQYQDSAPLTFSVGGPSVNSVTGDVMENEFPAFGMTYPQHTATVGSVSLKPKSDASGALLEDFGFTALVKSSRQHTVICVFGVWALGTKVSIDALIAAKESPSFVKALKGGGPALVVSEAKFQGLAQKDLRVATICIGA